MPEVKAMKHSVPKKRKYSAEGKFAERARVEKRAVFAEKLSQKNAKIGISQIFEMKRSIDVLLRSPISRHFIRVVETISRKNPKVLANFNFIVSETGLGFVENRNERQVVSEERYVSDFLSGKIDGKKRSNIETVLFDYSNHLIESILSRNAASKSELSNGIRLTRDSINLAENDLWDRGFAKALMDGMIDGIKRKSMEETKRDYIKMLEADIAQNKKDIIELEHDSALILKTLKAKKLEENIKTIGQILPKYLSPFILSSTNPRVYAPGTVH